MGAPRSARGGRPSSAARPRHPGRRADPGIIQPLNQDEVDQAAEAATTPAARLVLVLAAMHAARFKANRGIRLDDVDMGNRRIAIGGRTRPLDDITRQVLRPLRDPDAAAEEG